MLQTVEKPIVINIIDTTSPAVVFSTGSRDKQEEIIRIVGPHVVFAEELQVDEIQSRDPYEVTKKKARTAWEANGFSPVVVEDISFAIPALEDLLPSTYTKEWSKNNSSRVRICQLLNQDRRATARAIYAVYDGNETHIREGIVEGTIAETPRGTNGFGWDDIFIPKGDTKTFAEMTNAEKDTYSMRRKALEQIRNNPFLIGKYIFQLQDPYPDEIVRVRNEELVVHVAATQFAFLADVLLGNNPNPQLDAPVYKPVQQQEVHHNGTLFYKRFSINPKSPGLGLLLTNFIAFDIKCEPNGDPILWQMGPARRKLAIAQRIEYFINNQNEQIHALIDSLEDGVSVIPPRANKRIAAIERALEFKNDSATTTKSLDEIGYRKRSANKLMSRDVASAGHLLNKIGKHYRRVIGAGSMPTCTGSPDVLTTMALGHMVSFIPRNSRYAGSTERQIALFHASVEKIMQLPISQKWKDRAIQNIGVSLGVDDPQAILEEARQLYDAGIRLFRIYTINADPRVIETARLLRERFGDEIEIFVGQVADLSQAERLAARDIRADCIILGHGGGGQCTSAENGMAVTTLEELYEIIRSPKLNNITIAVEGSVGRNIGTYLLTGIDLVLFNQRIVRGGIEAPAGDLYYEHLKSTPQHRVFVQPNPGEASAETQTIEAVNPKLTKKRIMASGRTRGPEGKSGFMYFSKKAAGSMVFWINALLSDPARTFADLGYKNMQEMRQDILDNDNAINLLRLVSQSARYVGSAHAA